jgi:hypothetical protein
MASLPGLFPQHFAIGGAVNRSGSGINTGAAASAPAPGASGGINWDDPSFGNQGQGYNAGPNQAPTPYSNPSPGQYGGNPDLGAGQSFMGRPLPPGWQMTPMGPMPPPADQPYAPGKGWLNDPQNPNLSSGDIQRINRGGPGFMGNGYYINDPSAYRLSQADPMRQAYQQMVDPGAQRETRGQQQQLVGSLFGTLSGQTPSVAQQQLQNTTQGNVANAYAMGQSGRYNPNAARQVANNVGSINQQAAGQGALLRAQEIQNAQGQLGGVLGGMRQQDQSGTFAGLGGLANINQMMMNGRINQESQQQNAFYGTAGHAIGSQMIGGLASGASAAMGMMAHGGQVMGDRLCPGCGNLNSECVCGSRHMAAGGPIDSLANDVVPAMLSPGEIVLPRSVAMDKESPEKAKAFVEAIRAQRVQRKAA